MNTELKSQILEKIDQILKQMDLTKLHPNHSNVQPWNKLEWAEAKQLVNITAELLQKIKDNSVVMESISPVDVRNFDNHLTNFINQYNSHNLPQLNDEQITNQHHDALSQLHALTTTIKNSGIYTDLNTEILLKQKIDDLSKAETLVDTLLPNAENIKNATDSANQWLKTRRDVNGKTIEEQAEAFHDMAAEHKTLFGWSNLGEKKWFWAKVRALLKGCTGSWLWLLLAFIFASITGWVTYQFIIKTATDSQNIQVGGALLRIASLLVPAYLTLFSTNQFLYHKRLYNNYKFKYSSMNTMNHLMATHQERGEKILEKGLDILFSEPRTKESSGKYDTQLINELVKMLREQMK